MLGIVLKAPPHSAWAASPGHCTVCVSLIALPHCRREAAPEAGHGAQRPGHGRPGHELRGGHGGGAHPGGRPRHGHLRHGGAPPASAHLARWRSPFTAVHIADRM
jgi:hypothetical protein